MCGGWKLVKSKGLGDTVASVTNKLGIRRCGGCKDRQQWLNKKVPYSKPKLWSTYIEHTKRRD